jgi:hypothetical protein
MIAIVDPQATTTVMVGEGRTPVEVVPVVRVKGRRVNCCPQRARTPGPRGPFPCKTAVFGGPPEGTMIAIVDPQATTTVMVGEGRTPVEVVPVVRVKADEPISAPKGAPFPHSPMLGLTMGFAATREGGGGAMIVPLAFGEGHAPVGAVLVAVRESLDHPPPQVPADAGAADGDDADPLVLAVPELVAERRAVGRIRGVETCHVPGEGEVLARRSRSPRRRRSSSGERLLLAGVNCCCTAVELVVAVSTAKGPLRRSPGESPEYVTHDQRVSASYDKGA